MLSIFIASRKGKTLDPLLYWKLVHFAYFGLQTIELLQKSQAKRLLYRK